jgi:signal transduction histidine kinase
MNTSALLLGLAAFLSLIALYLIYWLYKYNKNADSSGGINIVKTKTSPEEMSHMIVHDLRAPVVAIKNSAALLIGGKLSKEDQQEMLQMIEDQSEKLLFQISTILDAGKMEKGKLTLNKELTDINETINEAVSVFESEAETKHINITCSLSNTLPKFYFDKVRLTEAINNIVSNSLKYSSENGWIRISTKQLGESVLLIISDNGIGISSGKKQDLFKKYSQAHVDSKTQKISSGLGLYITKWIIEAHGGTIRLDSEEGKGTTTKITVPLQLQLTEKEKKASGMPVIVKPQKKT